MSSKAVTLCKIWNAVGDTLPEGTVVEVWAKHGNHCSIYGPGELGYYRFKGNVGIDGVMLKDLKEIANEDVPGR